MVSCPVLFSLPYKNWGCNASATVTNRENGRSNVSSFIAVRFGRVPKREKAKMVEDMQRTTVQSQLDAVAVQYEIDNEAAERIQQAFSQLVSAVSFPHFKYRSQCTIREIPSGTR